MTGSEAKVMRKLLSLAAIISIAATLAQSVEAQGQTHPVKMERVTFAPAEVTVHVGDSVEWDNSDIVAHTATSKEGGFDVNVVPGRKGSSVMKTAGMFSYVCRYHPNMKGQIVVQP